ncbi:Annexin, partial [Aureobasidium melanogenum]
MERSNKSGPRKFREALKNGHCLIGPGVFDGISARVASTIGFDFLYLAGSGATGSFVGEPDLSTMTATEFATIGGMMVQHTDLPVIADADTGFGGPLNIARTVRLYEHAGVAGCHIEDQVFPKRCGQLKGKDVVDLQVYLERIRSAVMARVDPDFVIIARTDARQATRYGGEKAGREAFEEGVKRLKAALDAGADMAFMESPRTEEECSELVRALAPKPVLINVLPQGLTPALTTADCQKLGFAAAIYPCTGFIPAMLAMQSSYSALKNEGTDLHHCKGKRIQDFFEQVGLKESFDFDTMIENYSKEEVEHTIARRAQGPNRLRKTHNITPDRPAEYVYAHTPASVPRHITPVVTMPPMPSDFDHEYIVNPGSGLRSDGQHLPYPVVGQLPYPTVPQEIDMGDYKDLPPHERPGPGAEKQSQTPLKARTVDVTPVISKQTNLGLNVRMGCLSVGGNSPDTAGTLPPPSPLLEAYLGTYHSVSPMISPMRLPSNSNLDKLYSFSPGPSSDGKHHRRSRSSTSKIDFISSGTTLEPKKRARLYDAEKDALALDEAISHHRIDVDTICKILPNLTHDQILELRKEYKKHVKVQSRGINIAKHMKMKPSGNFGKAVSRHEKLIESLMGRSNAEIRQITESFKDERYNNHLVRCMEKELKPDKFRVAVLTALEARRQEENEVYPRQYVDKDVDVDVLNRCLTAKEGGESTMLEIVAEVNCHRPARDALLLRHAIDDISTHNWDEELRYELLISRLMRLQWDHAHLARVRREYVKKYYKKLNHDIENATRGDFRDFVYESCKA